MAHPIRVASLPVGVSPTPGPGEGRLALASIQSAARPTVRGKFLFVGDEKLYIRGVTYGAFAPDAQGNEYQDLAKVERDFAQMAAAGINAVRIPHTMPPRALLDVAQRHGLRVMVGLSAEQYVGYLIDRRGAPDVEAVVAAKVRECAGHPGLLCYALGNEIAAPMARWLGPERVQSYLERLYRVVKREDPEGLVTYVNYPTTEYLVLPFLDLLSFNVYLESQDRLKLYLARLQNIAGDRPLLMSELGLDSLRNGERAQAQVLDWQVRTAFAGGCAGVFIFSWTDEWYRHQGVADWAFGLTRADRSPKLGLGAVRDAFDDVPFSSRLHWPRVSVVERCAHDRQLSRRARPPRLPRLRGHRCRRRIAGRDRPDRAPVRPGPDPNAEPRAVPRAQRRPRGGDRRDRRVHRRRRLSRPPLAQLSRRQVRQHVTRRSGRT